MTTLVIPAANDDMDEVRDAARFVAQELGSETPWHIGRFFPAYRMLGVPPTPMSTIREAVEIGRLEGLRYVRTGNVVRQSVTTYHECGESLVLRAGNAVSENRVARDGTCPQCGGLRGRNWAVRPSAGALKLAAHGSQTRRASPRTRDELHDEMSSNAPR